MQQGEPGMTRVAIKKTATAGLTICLRICSKNNHLIIVQNLKVVKISGGLVAAPLFFGIRKMAVEFVGQ